MNNAIPCSAGNGIAFPLYRAKIDAPMEMDCLFGVLRETFGPITISNGSGRYGYKNTADISDKAGYQVARVYWGHMQPSATPCVDFFNTPSESLILRNFRTSCKHEVTSITIEHHLSYFRFDQLTSLCSRSVMHNQGGIDKSVEVRDSTSGRTISYTRDGAKVTIDSATCSLTIAVNPSNELRELLTAKPIRGAWSCAYWTRYLFGHILRCGDPLPTEFSHLFPEPILDMESYRM